MYGGSLITTLLYLNDLKQLGYLIDSKSELLNSATIITGDMAVSFELERKKIFFIDLWIFLNSKDIKRSQDIAQHIYKSSFSRFKGYQENRSYNFSNTMQNDLIFPLEAMFNASTVYRKIFRKYKVKNIYGFFDKPIALIRTGPAPNIKIANHISEGVLFFLANENKIKINTLKYQRSKINVLNIIKSYFL